MKMIFILLLLTSGCSVARYYQASDVTTELEKNSYQLSSIVAQVTRDFSDKEAFYSKYSQKRTPEKEFFLQDLKLRIVEMRTRRDAIISQSERLREVNNELMKQLENKKVVDQKDPAFAKIQEFSELAENEGKTLFKEVADYKNVSENFVRFAFFTGDIFRRPTGQSDD